WTTVRALLQATEWKRRLSYKRHGTRAIRYIGSPTWPVLSVPG
ncbi:hypothetical protein PPTG_24138, partial [Phytophthora nicotianae INRA-310]